MSTVEFFAGQISPVGSLTHFERESDAVRLFCSHGTIQTQFVDGMVRVRAARNRIPDSKLSYIVPKVRPSTAFEVNDSGEADLVIRTSELSVTIRRSDSAISVSTAAGHPLFSGCRLGWEG